MVFGHLSRGQRVWLGHTLFHGDLVPLAIEGREATWKNSSGNADYSKGSWPLFSGQKAALDRELYGRTCLWAENTRTHTRQTSLRKVKGPSCS